MLVFEPIRKIVIDASNICPLRCDKCARHGYIQRNERVPGETLNVENFKKLVEYFKDGVEFTGQISDPIMNKNLPEFLEILYHKKIRTKVCTAASQRSLEWFRDCFERNPKARWTFGLDGMPEESHFYRVNQDGEHLFEVMKMGASMGIDVRWQYIVFRYNEMNIGEAKELAKEHGITFVLNLSSRWNPNDPFKPSEKYVKVWGSEAKSI